MLFYWKFCHRYLEVTSFHRRFGDGLAIAAGRCPTMPHALIIDDDKGFREAISEVIGENGFQVAAAASLDEARKELSETVPDVVLLDLSLPDGNGADLIPEIGEAGTPDVVLITGHASVDSAVAALRGGVTDYLVKPLDSGRLQAVLKNVARRCDLDNEVSKLRTELRELGRFGPMIGSSSAMQQVYDAITRVAPTGAAVLINGESGTGKELVAQTVHEQSARSRRPFVALNCGAVSPTLIESELFGHERGSFTGASRTHRGYFERAAGGTLFLDEITEMPMELQIRLLRVLETGMVTRVGAEQEVKLDVRLLAATNRDPQQAVADGKLRQDLLYRLSVFPIRLPPLRERASDIHLLAEHFLAELNRQSDGAPRQFSAAAVDALGSHSWPGNVRELKNLVERSFILSDGLIEPEHLPFGEEGLAAAPAPASPSALAPAPARPGEPVGHAPGGNTTHLPIQTGMSIADAEKVLIVATLEACEGNKEQAAGALGISLKTLYNRLNQYHYKAPRKKSARARAS